MTNGNQFTNYYELIEYQGGKLGDKPYILFEDRKISFAEFDRATCSVANALIDHGARPGDGAAIIMGNCPEYYCVAHGLPRSGLYCVPVNTALKADGLRYILTHSEVKYLIIDDIYFSRIFELGSPLGAIQKIFVRQTDSRALPPGTYPIDELFVSSGRKPDHIINPDDITSIMYTSGTTGFPKGVINRNRSANMDGLAALAGICVKPDDILFTALPLFHANALMVTAGVALAAGVPFALEKRFSASGFWDAIRYHGATQFNAIGAMIPILMKHPECPDDRNNPVRLVISAACPANLWEPFEKRFDLTIWEAYGAIDAGGAMTFNFGDAPVGSVGKVINAEYKLIDDDGNEVSQGEIGELITRNFNQSSGRVEYFKNADATEKKIRNGWVYSGDLFYADKHGNLYFVDRKTDSLRRRGENISSFEVENLVEKHPAVEACAAFGVPSEMGEDEVMIWIKPATEAHLNLEELIHFCADKMAYFMVPRFIDVVDEIPRTSTLRVQKTEMKNRGVTERTWDREKEMPDLKLKK